MRELWIPLMAAARRFAVPVLSLVLTITRAYPQEKVTFQDHVLPLIEANCARCHNPDKKKANLDLATFNGALQGSGSGVVLVSGNPDSSKLWKAITHAEEPFMPPNRPKLSEKDLEILKRWILGGLLETSGSKAIAAAKPAVDLTLQVDASGKPDGPPPMPQGWPVEPALHTIRPTAITGLASSPWAPLVAVAGQKQVLLVHSDTLELLGILPFGEGQPVEVRFSRSGKLLLASGGEAAMSGRVVIWDTVSGERLVTLGDEYDTVLASDMRPDQSQVALGGPSRLVKILSTQAGELRHKIKKHTDWVTAVAFSPNNRFLASADRNGGVSVWDPDSGQELFTLAGHKSAVTALSWRSDAKVLASSSEDGTVKWWELQDGKQVKTWTAHNGGALSVHFAHDGRLVTCGRDNAVTVWKADGGKLRSLEFFGEIPLRATFSHDGKRVFASDFAGHVAAWNVEDGKRVGEIDPNPLPLASQLAAAEGRVEEIRARSDEASKRFADARQELAKCAAEKDAAVKSLEGAQATLTARESEFLRLKQEMAQTPSSDLEARLSSAEVSLQTARRAVTNAMALVESKTREVGAAEARLAKAGAEDFSAPLTQALAEVARIKAARIYASAWQLRQEVAAIQRKHDALATIVKANEEIAQKAEKNLAAAREAAMQAESQLKTARAEVEKHAPVVEKLRAEIAAQQKRLADLKKEQEQVQQAAARERDNKKS